MFDILKRFIRANNSVEDALSREVLLADTQDQLVGLNPWPWGMGITLLCVMPLIFLAGGMDFSSYSTALASHQMTGLTAARLNDSMHLALCGSFTHTLLEWTAVCAAFFVCVLALVQYKMTREPSLPVIGMALVCAGAMDAFHTLAADRLISAVADNRNLIPFTWAICRLFNSLILLIGVGTFVFTSKKKVGEWGIALIAFCSAGFIVVSYAIVHVCATSETLPNTMFPESIIKRPYDLLPLIPYLLCGLVVFPKYLHRQRTLFAYSLLISLIPQISAQLYMAFGSHQLHDSAFNIAHGLKVVAYGAPVLGLAMQFVRTHQQREQATDALRKAHDVLEARVHQRTVALKDVNQSLAESESRTRAILRTAAEGIVSIDQYGIVESFNEAASRIFGYKSEEVIGHNIAMLMPSPHAEQHDDHLARYRESGRSHVMGVYRELEAKRKDGSVFAAAIAISEVKIRDHLTFTGIVRDLTESKKIQVRLTQAQNMESIGQLAAGIAHEINTPTQYIGDNTRFLSGAFNDLDNFLAHYDQLLQATKINAVTPQLVANVEQALREADPEYLREEVPIAIQQSLEGIDSIAKIVRAMKDFSCTEGANTTLVDLNQAIMNTIAVTASEWRSVAEIVTDFDSELPLVPCIAGDINQALLQLIVNAAHAIADVVGDSGKKGTITVGTCRSAQGVEIRISDTGAGIPKEIQSRIFEPFFTTKEVGKGTGQGLHICYAVVVEKHGGTIDFETGPGCGTDFVIRLPIVENTTPEDASELQNAGV